MIRLFLIVVVLCFFEDFPVFGQQSVIDSLSKILPEAKGQQRVNVLNELASSDYDYNAERGFQYASEAFDLATELKFDKGIQRALTFKGYYFYVKGNYSKALDFYRQSATLPIPKEDLYGYNLVMMGNAFRAQANYDSAAIYYQHAIDLFTRTGTVNYLAFCYKNQGRLHALQWKNPEARESFQKALNIYKNSNNKKGIADTWFSLSDVSKNNSEFSEAKQYVEKACLLASEVEDEFLNVQCLINRGTLEFRTGEYTESLKTSFEALGILKYKDMPLMLTNVYSNIGDVYRGLGQNDVSMRYYLEALKIAERIGIKYEIAKLYNSMAWIFKNQNNSVKAHEYVDKSMTLRREIKDEHGISYSYSVLGMISFQEKKYSAAIQAFEQSLAIRKALNDREGVSSCLYNLSQIYVAQGQYPKALALQEEALGIEESVGNKFTMGFSHNRLGNIYTRLKKFKEAEGHLKKAEKLIAQTRSTSLLISNELNWSSYFDAIGNPVKSLQHYKRYVAEHDSLYSDIGAQKLAELQALYLMEQKDQEIEFLNQEKTLHENEIQLQRSRINLQNIVIISAIGGFIMVSLLAFMTYQYGRRINKANREITEQKEEIQSQSEELIDANQTIAEINRKLEEKIEERTLALSQAYKELDTFFYRSSHDFRRPLTTFLGLAEVAKVTVKDANALELFDKVRETATNLDKMLVKLQSISDVGSQQLVYKEVMIKEIFDTVCDNFRDELHRKNVKASSEIKLHEPFVSYPAMVKIIIENLVENAMHFSGVENPFIRLKASQNGDYITIDIQDNGQGIPKEYQEQIFDMYFRANERSKGNGLGLYIVKKAVEKLDGSITLSSIPLIGSTFTVMLPVNFDSSPLR